MNDKRLLWLPLVEDDSLAAAASPEDVARAELAHAGIPATLRIVPELGESWSLSGDGLTITGGATGVLYGAYRLLMARAAGEALPQGAQRPRYALRLLNCWDNAEGDIERGYSGRSLFFEGGRLCYDPARMRSLARLLASVGINVLCINNVNVRDPAHRLIEDWLPELAKLAGIFRPFGVRLMVSIDYAQPLRHGVPTADPLDPRVRDWWQRQTEKVYAAVPDLAGFLVKADSEHRPGPFTYGRNHAEGANMLARALAPFGGKLVWRCFVYNCLQDWRDRTTDRPMAAYQHYAPLDGQFDDNVILQIKNGPFDFQVREPLSPLLLAMPNTRLAIELQLAQEYTGHQIDVYAMPPMWREVFDDMGAERVQAIAAVSNLGRDANYTGHPFAAVNLFAYGQFAWNPDERPDALMRRWCLLTYPGLSPAQQETLFALLAESRSVYERYTAPLGLCWMVSRNAHYGPGPDDYEYDRWGTYHRADRDAVGVDRTERGTGYLMQYPARLRARYASIETCPEELLLFFHRVRYDHVMADGRTLIQRIYDDHFDGLEKARAMADTLAGLPLPSPDREEALRRMDLQLANAREWCDIINSFFHRLSGAPDAHGRTIY